LKGISHIPEASIYYHTHRFLEQHHYLSPEPPNDFAYWVTNVVNDEVLGEQLSSIDVVQFQSIGELRNEFISVLGSYLEESDGTKTCPPGEEFHFMSSRLFVLPTPYAAQTLFDFRSALNEISISSIYYHMFDARLRLGKGENDFSRWLHDLGYADLAAEIAKMDPYRYTLDGLRKRLMVLAGRYDKH
jgi:hypothetical protein